MGIRTATLYALAVIVLGYATTSALLAQKPSSKTQREIQTATTARAEMIAGRLNPVETKVGEAITLRLTEDVKSNGRTVLNKGTNLTALVRSVVQKNGDKAFAGGAQSMIELEWVPPLAVIPNVHQLMITLQSFTHMASNTPVSMSSPASLVLSPSSEAGPRLNGKANPALMSMPFIVPADERTTFALEQDFGFPSEEQMYRTGRGDMLSLDGKREFVELFSRLGNDTVILSNNRTFDITPGARMQLLVGVKRK